MARSQHEIATIMGAAVLCNPQEETAWCIGDLRHLGLPNDQLAVVLREKWSGGS
jgi:hypothetical protein